MKFLFFLAAFALSTAKGTDVAPMNPGELAGFMRSETEKFARLAKQAGIQPE